MTIVIRHHFILPTAMQTVLLLSVTINILSHCITRCVSQSTTISSIVPASTTTFLDPVIIPVSANATKIFNVTEFRYTSHPPHRKVYWIQTNQYPWRVVTPPPSPYFNNDRRYPLWKTSHQAQTFDCDLLAVNGGPFHKDGTSCGPLVVDGKVISNTSSNWLGIGWIDETSEWILGSYHAINVSTRLRLSSFVTGFQWLIYNGTVVAKDSDDPHRTADSKEHIERAPRTAVGVMNDGTLVVMVIDGCEKCFWNPGLSLTDLAEVMATGRRPQQRQRRDHHHKKTVASTTGVRYAINLDGGGSSTLIVKRQLMNRPTCLDVGLVRCERPVASSLCLSTTKEDSPSLLPS